MEEESEACDTGSCEVEEEGRSLRRCKFVCQAVCRCQVPGARCKCRSQGRIVADFLVITRHLRACGAFVQANKEQIEKDWMKRGAVICLHLPTFAIHYPRIQCGLAGWLWRQSETSSLTDSDILLT